MRSRGRSPRRRHPRRQRRGVGVGVVGWSVSRVPASKPPGGTSRMSSTRSAAAPTGAESSLAPAAAAAAGVAPVAAASDGTSVRVMTADTNAGSRRLLQMRGLMISLPSQVKVAEHAVDLMVADLWPGSPYPGPGGIAKCRKAATYDEASSDHRPPPCERPHRAPTGRHRSASGEREQGRFTGHSEDDVATRARRSQFRAPVPVRTRQLIGSGTAPRRDRPRCSDGPRRWEVARCRGRTADPRCRSRRSRPERHRSGSRRPRPGRRQRCRPGGPAPCRSARSAGRRPSSSSPPRSPPRSC